MIFNKTERQAMRTLSALRTMETRAIRTLRKDENDAHAWRMMQNAAALRELLTGVLWSLRSRR